LAEAEAAADQMDTIEAHVVDEPSRVKGPKAKVVKLGG